MCELVIAQSEHKQNQRRDGVSTGGAVQESHTVKTELLSLNHQLIFSFIGHTGNKNTPPFPYQHRCELETITAEPITTGMNWFVASRLQLRTLNKVFLLCIMCWTGDKSAATVWYFHVNMEPNLWGMFPAPCWNQNTENIYYCFIRIFIITVIWVPSLDS